eukprot:6192123-Pyramimonas_sp.AAC.1
MIVNAERLSGATRAALTRRPPDAGAQPGGGPATGAQTSARAISDKHYWASRRPLSHRRGERRKGLRKSVLGSIRRSPPFLPTTGPTTTATPS